MMWVGISEFQSCMERRQDGRERVGLAVEGRSHQSPTYQPHDSGREHANLTPDSAIAPGWSLPYLNLQRHMLRLAPAATEEPFEEPFEGCLVTYYGIRGCEVE